MGKMPKSPTHKILETHTRTPGAAGVSMLGIGANGLNVALAISTSTCWRAEP